MKSCQWCGTRFTPRARTSRFCSKQCAGKWQWRDQPRRVHMWGKHPPVDAAHRRLRAALLPLAIGTPCPLCTRIMDKTAELDHIIARALGGQTSRANCRIICAPCNRKRGSRLGGIQARKRRGPHRARAVVPPRLPSRRASTHSFFHERSERSKAGAPVTSLQYPPKRGEISRWLSSQEERLARRDPSPRLVERHTQNPLTAGVRRSAGPCDPRPPTKRKVNR
jgi:5-methylcytosine-specific restriction endonuclease McrA